MQSAKKTTKRERIRKDLENMYLDYFNNFLTVEAIAEHYGITENVALKIISRGRTLNQA